MNPLQTSDSSASAGAPEFLPESDARRARLPMWIVVLTALLVYRGCVYVDRHGGGFSPSVFAPFQSAKELALYAPQSAEDPLFGKGRKVYELCAACHQPNGQGVASTGIPPLAGSEWVLAQRPDRLVRIVLHGLQGPVKVLGRDYGVAAMTAFKDALSDEDIAAVLTFVRQNPEWGHSASAVKPEQVAAVRQAESSRALPPTAAELEKVPVE